MDVKMEEKHTPDKDRTSRALKLGMGLKQLSRHQLSEESRVWTESSDTITSFGKSKPESGVKKIKSINLTEGNEPGIQSKDKEAFERIQERMQVQMESQEDEEPEELDGPESD